MDLRKLYFMIQEVSSTIFTVEEYNEKYRLIASGEAYLNSTSVEVHGGLLFAKGACRTVRSLANVLGCRVEALLEYAPEEGNEGL